MPNSPPTPPPTPAEETVERPTPSEILVGVVLDKPEPSHPEDKATAEKYRSGLRSFPKGAVIWIPAD